MAATPNAGSFAANGVSYSGANTNGNTPANANAADGGSPLTASVSQPVGSVHRRAATILDPATRALLGVDPAHDAFAWHNDTVQRAFERNADRYSFRAEQYIGALLERGVRVLVYVGVNDFVCNWVCYSRF